MPHLSITPPEGGNGEHPTLTEELDNAARRQRIFGEIVNAVLQHEVAADAQLVGLDTPFGIRVVHYHGQVERMVYASPLDHENPHAPRKFDRRDFDEMAVVAVRRDQLGDEATRIMQEFIAENIFGKDADTLAGEVA